ncbi:MAG: hypothetical protein R2710_21150 [Acidimicrobiales bacterium]
MVSLDEAISMITAMPEVSEGSRYRMRTWFVDQKAFAWERPFTKADIGRFGDKPIPSGPILALITEDLSEKAAILAAGNDGFFTIAHFDNFPAVLVQLAAADPAELRMAITDAWLACAPEQVARTHLANER